MYYILTGAGFSKNWGGKLSKELSESLSSYPEIREDTELQRILLGSKHFEDALEKTEELSKQNTEWELKYKILQGCVYTAFREMHQSQIRITEMFPGEGFYDLEEFLGSFNTIFTTNQDLLLESNCPNLAINFNGQNGLGCYHPGIKPRYGAFEGIRCKNPGEDSSLLQYPNTSNMKLGERGLPYIKLHGSFNWRVSEAENSELMIIGSNKQNQIEKFPLIKWYFDIFKKKLSIEDSHLLVWGYSFSDNHVNEIIFNSIKSHNLKVYLWSPSWKKTYNNYKENFNDKPLWGWSSATSSGAIKETIKEIQKNLNFHMHS